MTDVLIEILKDSNYNLTIFNEEETNKTILNGEKIIVIRSQTIVPGRKREEFR